MHFSFPFGHRPRMPHLGSKPVVSGSTFVWAKPVVIYFTHKLQNILGLISVVRVGPIWFNYNFIGEQVSGFRRNAPLTKMRQGRIKKCWNGQSLNFMLSQGGPVVLTSNSGYQWKVVFNNEVSKINYVSEPILLQRLLFYNFLSKTWMHSLEWLYLSKGFSSSLAAIWNVIPNIPTHNLKRKQPVQW
jgi:hypothetical protein